MATDYDTHEDHAPLIPSGGRSRRSNWSLPSISSMMRRLTTSSSRSVTVEPLRERFSDQKSIWLSVGGTVSMSPNEHGSLVAGDPESLRAVFAEAGIPLPEEIQAVDQIDSTDMNVERILLIFNAIKAAIDAGNINIIVTTGTDTLEYLAPTIQKMVAPIIGDSKVFFIASMKPANEAQSDAHDNVNIVRRAANNPSITPGVYIGVNDGKLYTPQGLKKNNSSEVDAFISENGPILELNENVPGGVRVENLAPFQTGKINDDTLNGAANSPSIEVIHLDDSTNEKQFDHLHSLADNDSYIILKLGHGWETKLYALSDKMRGLEERVFHDGNLVNESAKKTLGELTSSIFVGHLQGDASMFLAGYTFESLAGKTEVLVEDTPETPLDTVYYTFTPFSDLSNFKTMVEGLEAGTTVQIFAYATGNIRMDEQEESFYSTILDHPEINFVIDSQSPEGSLGPEHYGSGVIARLKDVLRERESKMWFYRRWARQFGRRLTNWGRSSVTAPKHVKPVEGRPIVHH